MKCLFDLLVKSGDDPDYDRRNIAWYNIVMLSISMLFTYSTIKTLLNAMKILVWKIHLNDPGFMVDSNHIIGISILIMTIFYIIAPWIVFKSEPRIWMLLFSICVVIHISVFLKPIKYVLFGTSALVGITAALSSTAQAHYINLNTFYNNIGKNAEVFWSLLHGTMVVGNLFAYAILFDHNENAIPARKEQLLFYLLIVLSALGFLFTFFLGRQTVKSDEFYSIPWLLILKLIQLLLTKDMLLLCITFVYIGLQDTFMSGVYSNAIGFTMAFSEESPLRNAALSGFLIGVGTVCSIIFLGVGQKFLSFKWHIKIYTFGILLHIISYILIILNLPNDSICHPTEKIGIGMSNYSVALLCSFLLGFGDYCIHVELYALLIEKFENQFTPASFLQIFVTKLCSAIAYFYSSTQLYIVVGILLGMAMLGTVAFGIVEAMVKRGNIDELDIPRNARDRQVSVASYLRRDTNLSTGFSVN